MNCEMATAARSSPRRQRSLHNQKRLPLLPAESDNAPPNRPKRREVSSRYLSLSNSSANTTSSSNTSELWPSSASMRPRNSHATGDRVATGKAKSSNENSDTMAERMLKTSVRSLSVSFQGESFSLPVSNVKSVPTLAGIEGGVGVGTPNRRLIGVTPVRERQGRYGENSRPIYQQLQRWPGRFNGGNSSFLFRSLDHGSAYRAKFNGSPAELKELRKSSNDDCGDIKDRGSETERKKVGCAVKEMLNGSQLASPAANTSLLGHRGSVIRGNSPAKGLSPSISAALRGMATPARSKSAERNPMKDKKRCITPLSFAHELGRWKLGKDRSAADDLRLLHNRQLQWRLANARVENAMFVQKRTAERSLYDAWVSNSKLQHSVKSKRIMLQLSRQNLKLYRIMKEQMQHLAKWSLLDRDHSSSVSEAVSALKACTCRLPVECGAMVDVQMVHKALSSALHLTQSMTSLRQSWEAKVERLNALASELFNLSERERNLLDECKDLLSTTFIPLQIAHFSLMANTLQVQQ